jgi:subfamily B ATP-binding cassette protein MsbA
MGRTGSVESNMNEPVFKRLYRYIRPYRTRLAWVVAGASLVSASWAAQAYIVRPVLDDVFIKKDRFMLLILPLAVIGISAFKALANYMRGYMLRYVGNNIIRDIRNQLYRHVLQMPIGYYGRQNTGKLMSRVLNDVSLLQNVLTNVIKNLFQQVVTMVFLTGVLFYQNWRLASIAVIVLPFTYYPIRRFSKKLKRISHAGQEKMADLSSLLQETFSGIRIVKAFTAERHEGARFEKRNDLYFKNTMRAARISELTPSIMEFIGALGAAFIIWAGGYQVVRGEMTPGSFMSFLAACWLMYAPIRSISAANNTIQQSLAAVERVFQVLDTQTERHLEENRKILPPFRREVRFEGVSFFYPESAEPALDGIDLTVRAGEVVALVGLSGAGKTTLVNLLPRFFEPTRGAILIDGLNIRDVTLDSLRGQIGIVSQDTVLFDDTVANNIAYGRSDASLEAIRAAAESAYAHPFIERMPEGYDTMIGERGVRLSGGERQRLAIARALLKNPPILILDEATSNLDAESEQIIQKALGRLLTGRTTFVIAHRLSTVMNAHRILVVENGRIIETGRHAELLQKGGVYKKLYELQFKEAVRVAET